MMPAIYDTHVSIDRLEGEDGSIIAQSLISVGPGGLIQPFGWTQKIKAHGNIYPRSEVKFPKAGPFEDQPVLETLVRCAELVSEAVDVIEEFIVARAAAGGASS